MSIFDRSSLQASSLADLHAIASELSIDGYRRLRKDELIGAILDRQSAGASEESPADPLAEALDERDQEPPSRRRRGGRRRRSGSSSASEDASGGSPAAEEVPPTRASSEADASPPEPEPEPEQRVEGVVELLPGGSGFVRVNPPEP